MEKNTLRELLEQVDHEIRKTETLDQQGRELLTHLAADINELLERSNPEEAHNSSVLGQLALTIEHFETSHPQLTHYLSQLSAVLSNAGI